MLLDVELLVLLELGGVLLVEELLLDELVVLLDVLVVELVELLGGGLVEVLVLVVVVVDEEVDTCGCVAKLMNCWICG